MTAGQFDLVDSGGVESVSRVPMSADGGAWAVDPQITSPGKLPAIELR
jgi:acetyl-CoA C-acetyltransferase